MTFEELIVKYKELIRQDRNSGELYKWQCVKHFQDNFNIDALNFHEMFKRAIYKRVNLLYYISSSFILEAAEQYPDETRQMFRSLYNEEVDLKKRIQNFQLSSNAILPKLKNVDDKSRHQQDERTLSFYLALRYPEKYPLYMSIIYDFILKTCCGEEKQKVGDKFLHFIQVSHKFSDLIDKDTELHSLVKSTLDESCYKGKQSMMIFQDILWRCNQEENGTKKATEYLIKSDPPKGIKELPKHKSSFNGVDTDYEKKHREATELGKRGEELVIKFEKDKLKGWGMVHLADKVKKQKDGVGHDILSFDKNGNEILIEVKTTNGGIKTSFEISPNEINRAKKDQGKYFIYRLYNFDKKKNKAKYYIVDDIDSLLLEPVNYKAYLK